MDNLFSWLFGTPIGLLTLGGIIYLIRKNNKEPEKKKKSNRKTVKTNTVVITETQTKITKIKSSNTKEYEKDYSRNNNRNFDNDAN